MEIVKRPIFILPYWGSFWFIGLRGISLSSTQRDPQSSSSILNEYLWFPSVSKFQTTTTALSLQAHLQLSNLHSFSESWKWSHQNGQICKPKWPQYFSRVFIPVTDLSWTCILVCSNGRFTPLSWDRHDHRPCVLYFSPVNIFLNQPINSVRTGVLPWFQPDSAPLGREAQPWHLAGHQHHQQNHQKVGSRWKISKQQLQKTELMHLDNFLFGVNVWKSFQRK